MVVNLTIFIEILAKYGQDPAEYLNEDGEIDYHRCGMIYEWHEVINDDPEMLVKFSQISGEVVSKAMYGDAEESADMTIEGVNLDTYARISASIQGKSETEAEGIITGLGLDIDTWKKVNAGFTKAMEEDTSLKLATHFGELFAKYGTAHMDASTQASEDIIAEAMDEHEEQEELQRKAIRDIMKMAVAGDEAGILPYLKKTFPEDADDEDALDWYIDNALDKFEETGNKDGARVLFSVRYDLMDEEGDKEEWIDDELDSLFL
jgi:hypothetical protein